MPLSEGFRLLAQSCGITIEDAARMVADSNKPIEPSQRDDDYGVDPYRRFKERLARPNADLPRHRSSYDLD